MKNWKNALIGLIAAVVFSLFYLVGVLTALEDRLYDLFLSFRVNRERVNDIVFLDVDDSAIQVYGLFPWPRSIMADGLLRLKEYGARAVIFDIEYIDRGPEGVDSLYLEHGLGSDFERSFSDINSFTQQILAAFEAGRIRSGDISDNAERLSNFITSEKISLYNKAQSIARDNDIYLAQAMALNGNAWATVNLWSSVLEGEQADRREVAEKLLSYPVKAAPNAFTGTDGVDILPVLPVFANAAKGAGYTNVVIDDDGVRRRVYLTQQMFDHWYLQLAFAPLIDYLGRPEIILEKRKMIIKQAKMPDGRVKDITIPLDKRGRMLLDWPKTDFARTYNHVSFTEFSFLDEYEIEIEKYCRALSETDINLFARFEHIIEPQDSEGSSISLFSIPVILGELAGLFDAVYDTRQYAMENTCDDSFNNFVNYRNMAFNILRELFAEKPAAKILTIGQMLCEENPDIADMIEDEAEYIASLLYAIEGYLNLHAEINESNKEALHDKFIIIGWVSTGTTDYGANPFFGKYINVGTHGVVLDTILSESFIIPIDSIWLILFMIVFIPLFFILSARLAPVLRASSGLGATIVFFFITIILFRYFGIFWGPLGTVLAMITAIIIREIIYYASSEKEKKFIRTAFSTYVSSDIVKEIIADPSRLQLGGSKRYMTALFTDVKGFSSISEALGDPAKLVSLLNKYLSAMSDVVLEEKGTIDKYVGDAIVAFFGAPLDLPDHALRACVSAIKMRKIEQDINREIIEQNLSPTTLHTRVGVNTGFMVAGNMGTANKMNYTIMGNAVNLAARLEGVNKQYGTWILASEDSVRETGDTLLYRKLDRVRVVGILEPVRLCELLDMAETASEIDKKLVLAFHEALDCFEKRQWKQAAEGFNEALVIKADDDPSKMFLERCEKFVAAPPKETWDGVYNLTTK
ncbi:MAG: adenylate/guanylate cyclase domain-containing protein [Treponema sp.]|nr:adenylate/guanylate cyclase domain-containing protein [Treponema sp.]